MKFHFSGKKVSSDSSRNAKWAVIWKCMSRKWARGMGCCCNALQTSFCSCSVLAKTDYFPHYSDFGSSPCRSFWLLKTLTATCLWFACLRPLPGETAVKQLFCQSRGREIQRIPWAAGGRGDEGRQSLGEDRIWGFHFMSLHPSTCVIQSGGLTSNSLSSPCQRTPSD